MIDKGTRVTWYCIYCRGAMGIKIDCVGFSRARCIDTDILVVVSQACIHNHAFTSCKDDGSTILLTCLNVYHPHEIWWHQMKHLLGEACSWGYDWGRIVAGTSLQWCLKFQVHWNWDWNATQNWHLILRLKCYPDLGLKCYPEVARLALLIESQFIVTNFKIAALKAQWKLNL